MSVLTPKLITPRLLAAALGLATLLIALPAGAYTVYLKDGSKIVADKKYDVVDGKALIVLPSGTTTSIDFSEIDVERTERANRQELGTAVILEDGKSKTIEPSSGAPRSRSLSEIIAERGVPELKPSSPGTPRADRVEAPLLASGWTDLAAIDRVPYPNGALAADLRTTMSAQGVDRAEVWSGTRPGRAFVEVRVTSESEVFRALLVAATALLQLGRSHGGELDQIELLMLTANDERGGQFTLTTDDARALTNKEIGVREFFLAKVEF